MLDKQTIRLIIANANEMAQRPDVFVRFMRAYRESLDLDLFDAGGARGLRAIGKLSEATAKRALNEFLPKRRSIPTGFPASRRSWPTR